MDKKKSKIGWIIFWACMFVLLQAIIVVMNQTLAQKMYMVPGTDYEIPLGNICGGIVVLQLLVSVILVGIDDEKGFAVAFALHILSIISMCSGIIRRHDFSPMTGILMILGGLIIITVLRVQYSRVRQREQTLEYMSRTDFLTQLYNRRGMQAYIQEQIEKKNSFVLCYMDLDNFKQINDTLGHDVGDTILIEISNRMVALGGEYAVVGRNGGDEFVMTLQEQKDFDIDAYVRNMLQEISKEIYIEEIGYRYFPSVSIGIARYPEDEQDIQPLMRCADAAMYEAKRKGKNTYCIYHKTMRDRLISQVNMENKIRNALIDDTFYLVYQPQFRAENKQLRGFEALIRMRDEQGTCVSPREFIPVAEKSGLILEIDHYVLRRAMKEFSAYVKQGDPILVSVNLSAKHLTEKGLVEEIQEFSKEYKFPLEFLEIEITEYCLLESVEQAVETLKKMRELGIHIALDDFGTGYASMRYLSQLPIDLLKIDKSFIDEITTNMVHGEFVNAAISMGHMLDCEVISEGVEDMEQLNILKQRNCDYIQGYLWGKPLEYNQAMQILTEYQTQMKERRV